MWIDVTGRDADRYGGEYGWRKGSALELIYLIKEDAQYFPADVRTEAEENEYRHIYASYRIACEVGLDKAIVASIVQEDISLWHFITGKKHQIIRFIVDTGVDFYNDYRGMRGENPNAQR